MEQTEALKYLQENNPRVYETLAKRFDRNGDGKLDAAEGAAMFQFLAYIPSVPQGQEKAVAAKPKPVTATAVFTAQGQNGAKIYGRLAMQAFDKNHEGKLNADEQAAKRSNTWPTRLPAFLNLCWTASTRMATDSWTLRSWRPCSRPWRKRTLRPSQPHNKIFTGAGSG